jgi:hypothetical protein
MAKALRFGARDGERYSQYWKASAAAAEPELIVSGNRTGRFFHLTMHENEAFWHAKIKVPDEEVVHPWQPPKMWLPGVRRLLQILIPIEAVRYELESTKAERVTWFPGPPDDQSWTEFTVLHCAEGRPEIRSAITLGTVEIADGSEAMVIARNRPAEAGRTQPVTRTVPAVDVDELRRRVKSSDTAMLMSGIYPDGCLWILELMSRPRDTANLPA